MIVPPPSIGALSVVVSDHHDDVDLALRMVHDGFVGAGFMRPAASGRRLIAPYLNPGTLFAIASIDGTPVGAASLIPDGPFGLPSDRAFVEEIDALRAEARGPVLEGGSLAIAEGWRGRTRKIFPHLMAALARKLFEMGDDAWVIMSVAPEMERLVGAMFAAQAAAGPRPLYRAPAVLLMAQAGVMRTAYGRGATPVRKVMGALALDGQPTWLVDRTGSPEWPGAWLAAIAREQDLTSRLESQLRIIAERFPSLIAPDTTAPELAAA